MGKKATHICGTADEREKPSPAHAAWHRNRKEEACGKSQAEQCWYHAERRAGRSLPDWKPQEPLFHKCGTADDREEPSSSHYSWHRNRNEEPCEKALAEAAWATAEQKAGRPLPDWKPVEHATYVCGDREDVTHPDKNHWQYHRSKGEPCCGLSASALAWATAEDRAGRPLPDWKHKVRFNGFECGTADEREQPGGAHLFWHRRRNEEPCDKSRAESNWYAAERRAGHPLPDWKPHEPVVYICGDYEDRERPSGTHLAWHKRQGTDPCPKAYAEQSWYHAERRAGHPLPDWKPTRHVKGQTRQPVADAALARLSYICGTADEAAEPGDGHYIHDRLYKGEPCGKALKERQLAQAERDAGRSRKTIYVCGSADKAERPGSGHYLWHKRRGTSPCDKSRAEMGWQQAERKAGQPVPDYKYVPKRKNGHQCGEEQDAKMPGSGHYNWHKRNGTEPCEKSYREMKWARAEKRAGKPLPDWQPPAPITYECGTAEDAESPQGRHLAWHKTHGTEPCEKAKVENRWYRAEYRAGHPLPNYKPIHNLNGHICGTAEDATGPNQAHYDWHKYNKTDYCDKSRREIAWYNAEKNAGHPLPDWEPFIPEVYVCGTGEEATKPGSGHHQWHIRNETEPCDKSLWERSWYMAERHAGETIPNWRPPEPVSYPCGPPEDAEGPSTAHYGWHNHNGTPACGRAKKENAWDAAEKRYGYPLPDYEYLAGKDRSKPTALYRITGGKDLDIYIGISQTPDDRYQQHHTANTLVGEMLRSDTRRYFEILHWYPNWDKAEQAEKQLIKEGNPFGGRVVNITHRDYETDTLPDPEWLSQNKETSRLEKLPPHTCGTADQKERPTGAHRQWHSKRGETPCKKAHAEEAWYRAERKAGHPITDYIYVPKPPPAKYVCGEAEDATGPSNNHYSWHNRAGTKACDKSLIENRWYRAEKNAGHPLPDWQPRKPVTYECGPAEAANRPNEGHYGWHNYYNTEHCEKSKAELRWYRAEKRAGHPLPDWAKAAA